LLTRQIKSPNYSELRATPFLVRIRGPARDNPEIPILNTLSRHPETGLRTRIVIVEVKKYYQLSATDLQATYPNSGRRIIDSIIKFGRKHLVEKDEVYPIQSDCPMGVWKATPTGLERVLKQRATWKPAYSRYSGMVS